MVNVLLANDDLTVLGGPSSVSVDVGIGATGERGSIIYGVSADPRLSTTTKPSGVKVYDIVIVINPSQQDYRVMYQKTGPGNEDWSELIDLNLVENKTKSVTNVSTNYSVTAEDRFSLIQSTSTSAINVTVDDVLSQGESISFIQDGTGAVSFVAGTGVTLNGLGTSISAQYGYAEILCVSSGEYRLVGDIS
jgi:hypothetical protein